MSNNVSARQSHQLSSVFSRPLPTDYPKQPPDYAKLASDYSKLPPDYTQVTSDYSKLPPDYARITNDYLRDSSHPPVPLNTGSQGENFINILFCLFFLNHVNCSSVQGVNRGGALGVKPPPSVSMKSLVSMGFSS